MSEFTPEQLRELPQKARWSEDEALALYTRAPDGTELCVGGPIPQYVQTREQRVRWSHAARVATQIMGEPVTNMGAGQLARTLYTDTNTYTTD